MAPRWLRITMAGAAAALAGLLVAGPTTLAGAATTDAADQAGTAAVAEATQAPGDEALTQFLDLVLADVTATWSRILAPLGGETGATGRWFSLAEGTTIATGCGLADADGGPFYCPADDTIYLSTEFAAAVLAAFGDMAVVAVLAHEYGHNVQAETGLLGLDGEAVEAQADCFGGAYAADAQARGLLEPGDEAEARAVTRAAGDTLASSPQGTPEEREAAWSAGFEGGVAACL